MGIVYVWSVSLYHTITIRQITLDEFDNTLYLRVHIESTKE